MEQDLEERGAPVEERGVLMSGHTVPWTLVLESPPSASNGHSWTGLRWGSQGKSRSPGQGQAACGRVTGLCSKSAHASLGSAHHSCHLVVCCAVSWQWNLRSSPSRTRTHMLTAQPVSPEPLCPGRSAPSAPAHCTAS